MKRIGTLLVIGWLAATTAWAQTTTPGSATGTPIVVGTDAGYPPTGFGTIGGSYLFGHAAVIGAQGLYNQATAQAIDQLTQARKREFETARAYQEMRRAEQAERLNRRLNDDLRQALRQVNQAQATRMAQQASPGRLRSSEFDVATGRIAWPSVLQMAQFAPLRQKVEQLFAQRASLGELPAENHTQLDGSIEAMSDSLRGLVYQLPPDLYVTAKRFLNSLAYEATLTAAPRSHIELSARPGVRAW